MKKSKLNYVAALVVFLSGMAAVPGRALAGTPGIYFNGLNATPSGSGNGSYSISIGDNKVSATPNAYAVAMGYDNTASGIGSVAFGYGNSTDPSGAHGAIGAGSFVAGGIYSVDDVHGVVSYPNTASGISSVAMGVGNTASGAYSVAIGAFNTTADSGTGSVAMGYGNTASGMASVAMGGENIANGTGSVAMGVGTYAKGEYSVAFGYGGFDGDGNILTTIGALGNYSFVAGYQSTAYGKGSVAFGNSTAGLAGSDNGASIVDTDYYAFAAGQSTASGKYSVAMGIGNTASGEASVAIGDSAYAQGTASVALSGGTTGSGADHALAMGSGSTAEGNYSVAMGYGNTAREAYSVAMGYQNTASGRYSVAMGNSTASGWYATAFGYNTGDGKGAIGDGSFVAGGVGIDEGENYVSHSNTAIGRNAVAMGESNNAYGIDSITIGYGAQTGATYTESDVVKYVGGDYAVAMGNGAKAYAEGSVAFGSSIAGAISGEDGGSSTVTVTGGSYAFAAGSGSTASGNYSVAMGNSSKAEGENSVALGGGTATPANSFAFGGTVASGHTASVALGYGSVTGGAYEVSVGSGNDDVYKTRKITNVTAGTIGENSTDAVTGGQLYTTNQNVSTLQGYFDANGIANKATADKDGNEITATYATKTELGTVSDKVTALETATSGLDATKVTQITTNKDNITTLQSYFTDGKANNALAAETATKATQDGSGNVITTTYATKTELTTATTMSAAGNYYSSGDSVITAIGNVDGQVKTNTDAIANLQATGISVDKVEQITTNKNAIALLNGDEETTGSVQNTVKTTVEKATTLTEAGNYYAANDNVITAIGKLDEEIYSIASTGVKKEVVEQVATNATNIEAIQQYVTEDGLNANGKKITNVAAGTNATDAVNYQQHIALANSVDQRFSRVNEEIGRTGAAAAALASLHPQMMKKGESQVMAGLGRYHGKSGAAVGLAWQPHQKVMVSGGFADAAGEIMFNVGASYLFGTRAYTQQEVEELNNGKGTPLYAAELNAALKSKDYQIKALKTDSDAMKAELAELKAIVAQLVKQKK